MDLFWKKQKETHDEAAPNLAGAIHSMEDDLKGKPPISTPATQENNDNTPVHAPGTSFFQAKKPKASSEHGRVPENLPISPFLDTEGEGSQAPVVPIAPTSQKEAPAPEPVVSTNQEQEPNRQLAQASPKPFLKKKLLLGISAGLALILIGGGTYYYFFLFKKNVSAPVATPVAPPEAPTPPSSPSPETESPTPPRFSAEKPNLLSLNTETATAESIHLLLLDTAEAVKKDNLPGAVEFLIRDQNYNPLAFSRFAYLAKMDFPSGLLTETAEAFSLFIFLDQGRPHVGLVLSMKNGGNFPSELVKAEKSLPQAISPLFIDVTTAPKTGLVFKDGTYGTQATRYANIDSALNLSFDYALTTTFWAAGTSRDTLRAVLDKMTKNLTAPSVPAAATPPVIP